MKLDNEVAQIVTRLEEFPLSGRAGRVEGTREFIAGNYVLIYQVSENRLEVLGFIRDAWKYPSFLPD